MEFPILLQAIIEHHTPHRLFIKSLIVCNQTAQKAIVIKTVAFLRSKGLAPPVAPRMTNLRWVRDISFYL